MTNRIIRGRLLTGVAKRISLLFLLAAMLPSAALFWLTYNTVSEISEERIHHRLAEKNHAYAMTVLERLVLAESMLKKANLSQDIHRSRLDILHPFPFRSIARFAANGQILDQAGVRADLSRLSATLEHIQGGHPSKTSLHVLAAASPEIMPDIAMAIAGASRDGEKTVVFGALDPQYLWGDPDLLSQDINICVLGPNHIRLSCAPPRTDEASLLSDAENTARWQLFLNGPFHAENWLFAARLAHAPRSDLGRFLGNFTIVALLSVLLVSLLSLIQIRRTMGPLTSLVLRARKIAGGNFVKVEIGAKGEFSELADAFNDMSGRISRQIGTLRALSAIDREIQTKLDTVSVFKHITERIHLLLPDCLVWKAVISGQEHHAAFSLQPYDAPLKHMRIDLKVNKLEMFHHQHDGAWTDAHALGIDELDRFIHECGYTAWWVIPLTWHGAVLGFMGIGCKNPSQISDEAIDEMRELAGRLALAISSHEREQRLQYQARFDSLTGLPNRFTLFERLENALASQNPHHMVAVLFIDIDRFKFINDTLGHKAGDSFIKNVATRLTNATAEEDIVARLGGDEFVVVMQGGKSKEEIRLAVERITQDLAAPFLFEEREYVMTCSIGIAVSGNRTDTAGPPEARAEEIVESADIAMYRAKLHGRNNYQFYTAEMRQNSLERLRLDADLRKALDNDEFFLEYQPQIDLRTGQITGTEALLRWQHPELGLIPPLRFIGLIEEIGLIVPIGEWVIKTACAQAKAWQQAGLGMLRMAINISAAQFSHPKFADTISQIADDYELPPECLELELTESILMANADHALDTMHKLRSLGLSIAVDDFGTGYSSLSYLKQFPVNILKIDRSFVSGLARDTDDLAIVQSVIALAHRLNLRVIAEGVETLEHLACLQESGCDEIQGYLFSKPVRSEEMTKILRNQKSLYPLQEARLT